MGRAVTWVRGLLLAVLLAAGSSAHAELARMDIGASLYTKWLYRNNDSQGLLTYGNPFWPDNIAGDNGVGTELEIRLRGNVGPHVQAGARIKSRWGAKWHDWWENGDIRYGGEVNTSGESIGMNAAQYMKLRGYWVRFSPPIPGVDWIHVGSSDLGFYNPWTIGKIRFIDRDNGKGVFVQGHIGRRRTVGWHLGVIALPKLWVGPSWSTGIGDPNLPHPFYSNDYAYAARVDVRPTDWADLHVVASVINDLEIDFTDPDAQGTLYPTCQDALGNPVPGCEARKDHAVGTFTRYFNAVTTLEAELTPWDVAQFDLLGGLSMQRIDPQLAANGVAINDGVFPMPFADIDFGDRSYAVRARAELFDPFDIGLDLQAEYFNIGENWVSMFGARREADVLLTDGFVEGGQLPTLNLANEFMDFDEPFYESCIGWHGATLLPHWSQGDWDVLGEYTFLTYNTNGQNRDVEKVYPDFLHTDGFTDTDLFDYANTSDRGRDPRSVYRANQDRLTHIARLEATWTAPVGRGLEIKPRLKGILDYDLRSHATAQDDYRGIALQARLWIAYPVTDELRLAVGGQLDRWWETNRDGSLQRDAQGKVVGATYEDVDTTKTKLMADLRYDFEGVHLHYYFEWVRKDQARSAKPDQFFDVFRSKATLEVAW